MIAATDKEGRERLFNYCGRPVFEAKNLERIDTSKADGLRYWIPKTREPTKSCISLSPLEFIERLSHLIPPPYRNRLRYHGVFAPNSPMRKVVTSYAKKAMPRSGILPLTEKLDKGRGSNHKCIKIATEKC